MNKKAYIARHTDLKQALTKHGLDLWLQPVADEFQGEYTAPYAARLEFITGFSGSAGLGIFSREADEPAVLMVDGRYTLQAAEETDPITTTILNSGEVQLSEYLNQKQGALKVGFDPMLHAIAQVKKWRTALEGSAITFVPTRPNLIDTIWRDQPSPPSGNIYLQSLVLAGQTAAEKISPIKTTLHEYRADAVLITQPDAICWMLNLRGEDIPYNPLLLAYALLRRDGALTLFTFERIFSQEVLRHFKELEITVQHIRSLFEGDAKTLGGITTLMLDTATAPYSIALMAEKSGIKILEKPDPIALPKACKNDTELNGMRLAHLRDGLAVTRFLHWMNAQTSLDELTVVAKLEEFRAHAPSYRGPSFATIAGAGPHGAIVHYRASITSNRTLAKNDLLLVDSGGQYDDGTTDITRTIAFGAPSDEMRRHFTLVLKGHIALASARFPAGTSGQQLDALARQYLWAAGLDYDHGTGHGVGAYLCVHEGPQRISKKGSDVALIPGMILSNEPGYYEAGAYGIRIENLVAVVTIENPAPGRESAKPLLGFETLTLAPIDRRLVMVELLRPDERVWLNAYHARVYHAHQSFLSEVERQWLEAVTAPI
ncbi:MAG: M24 family metallopeptidase [Alphaproteobacteria bacterium]